MNHSWVVRSAAGLMLATLSLSPFAARADGFGGPPACGPAGSTGPIASSTRPAVIVDTDVDFDDTAALAYLCSLHTAGRIELKAVTVTNDGSGFPGDAIRNARCVLAACGQPNIPVADGSDTGVNAFSPVVRSTVGEIIDSVVSSCTASNESSEVPASELIRRTVLSSDRPITLVTLGPLTNVAAALRWPLFPQFADPLITSRIDRAFIMGGAVHVGGDIIPPPPFPAPAGNFDGTQELNIWADPASAQFVFSALTPLSIRLVATDATQDVPVTVDFINQLAAKAASPAADFVDALVHQPIFFGAISGGVSFSWSDPLDAIASDTSDVVTYEWDKISVVQSGVSQGRTVAVAPDQPGVWMRVGVKANATNFTNDFISVLNED